MKKTTFIVVSILFLTKCFSQAPNIQWQIAMGGSDYDEAFYTKPTSDGGYITAGYSYSNDGDVTLNQGSGDYWIVKQDALGVIQWQRALGGTGDDYPNSVQQTSDGGYIVAGSTESIDGDATGNQGSSDYWIVKLDASGVLQWQKTLGGSGFDNAYSIQQTTDGGYIVAGSTDSNDGDITGNHGQEDIWVVKLDALGVIQWQKIMGGSSQDIALSAEQTSDNGYIVAGWSYSNDGDVSGNQGLSDLWVIKLDVSGGIEWQKTLGGSDYDSAYAVHQTSDGGYVVGGSTYSNDGDVTGNHGNLDSWIVKLSGLGVIEWQKTVGGNGDDYAYGLQQTTDGGFIVASVSNSNDGDVSENQGSNDSWIVKLDSAGILKWQKAIGGTSNDYPNSIEQTSDGGFIISGYSESNDGDVTENQGGGDCWIVKLSPEAVLSNSDFSENNMVVYPNPAVSKLNLRFPSEVKIDKIIITDLNGKEILQQTVTTNQINTEKLATGMYIIQASSGVKQWESKFMKK